MKARRHSEAVLSDLRESWWSYDYLELISHRLDLGRHEKILDIGCGQGHWGLLLLPLFAPSARLTGIDGEIDWISRAIERSEALDVADRCHFQRGDAMKLPYADASFDLVTCQTLLMHLADPDAAISEMLRVLRPGGRLLAAEPSNLPNQFSTDTLHRALSPEEISQLAYLFVCSSRGRDALGRGDDSIADRLPAMLAAQGLQEIGVFQNERPSRIAPPYSALMRADLEEELDHARRGYWLWDQDDARSLYAAGGGDMARFDEVYAVFLRRTALFAEQVRSQSYARTGGAHHYLVTGTLD